MTTITQFIRYGIVGLLSNGLLYLAYLFLTTVGMGPKLAMSLLYALGIAQTFFFNKSWTFRHRGLYGPTFVRYCSSYGLGYLVNLLVLLVLVDIMSFPHQIVQGAMILLLAAMLFTLHKFWVFRAEPVSLN